MRWQARAACLGDTDPAWLEDVLTQKCAITCVGCPVRLECLTEALPREVRWDSGIWGGTTPRKRGDIRRGVVSITDAWRTLERVAKEGDHG